MENLIIIKSKEDLPQLIKYINENEYIAVDTETTGTNQDSKIIGFSVSADPETGYYVILSYWDKDQKKLIELETLESTKEIFQLLQLKKLIVHNCIFDCSMISNNFGVELIDSVYVDTMILSHLLDENRHNGLKELGVSIFGEESRTEQIEMKNSVVANGGSLTKINYELYKADCDLIARYGAKDTILTIKLFYNLIPKLFEESLDTFFFEESMPLVVGPTYDLNRSGLRIDVNKLAKLRGELEIESMILEADIRRDIEPKIKHKYAGTNKKNTFNINSNHQISWLLFDQLKNTFVTITDAGREICETFKLKMPYSVYDKTRFVSFLVENKGLSYGANKTIKDYWTYLSVDKESLKKFSSEYRWVEKLLQRAKNLKILNFYVIGIQERLQYGIIRPSFLQHGTTSGRYSSRNPNFQNLPKDDRRIKECIVSRPGTIFVGADYSQLEPRVFTSVSQDPKLLECFEKGQDFYSVVGAPIFEKNGCSLYKNDENSFAKLYPDLRHISKQFALATPYGTSATQQSRKLEKPRDECQQIIDRYFEAYPKVELMMLESHEMVKLNGVVYSLYGRPRRIPEGKTISKIYGTTPHSELPYKVRNKLNLAMNHRVQSSAASIVNRASIELFKRLKKLNIKAHLVLQVHDSIVVECEEHHKTLVAEMMQDCMENTVKLPGVRLEAVPKFGYTVADV